MEQFHFTKRTSNKIWYIGFLDNGKLRWRSTGKTHKADAVEFSKTFTTPVIQSDGKPSLSQFKTTYTELHGISLRKKSLQMYLDAVDLFTDLIGDKTLSQYTPSDVEVFKNKLREKGLKDVSINVHYRSLKSVFSFAYKHDFIDKTPFSKCSPIKLPQSNPVYLTKPQMKQLLDKVDDGLLKDMFEVTSLTGMRLNEVTCLTWHQVDFLKKHIVMENHHDFMTKSGKSRVIPLHRRVISILRHRSKSKSEYVFSKSNGYRWSKTHITRQFKRYRELAGLPVEIHFHSLRHTTASWLVNNSVPLYEVQNILGHSSINTTQIYAHLSPKTLLRSVNRI